MTIGSHHSANSKTDEWITPPEIIKQLGPFDLDPCSPIDRPWDTAKHHYTVNDNGLSRPWNGFVWCNPPYGKKTSTWMAKMADHHDGIALLFARTETKTFFKYVWPKAWYLIFIEGRLRFHHKDGTPAKHTSGGPSVLIGYGFKARNRLMNAQIKGAYVDITAGFSLK